MRGIANSRLSNQTSNVVDFDFPQIDGRARPLPVIHAGERSLAVIDGLARALVQIDGSMRDLEAIG